MNTLSVSKISWNCKENGEKNVEDQAEAGTLAECVRDQTVQKGLKGLTVVLPENEEILPRDMGILKQCMLKNRKDKMPLVQRG